MGAALVGGTVAGGLAGVAVKGWLVVWYDGRRGLSLFFRRGVFGLELLALQLWVGFFGVEWFATVPPIVRLATGAAALPNTSV
ncbi:MFS transporter, partial [Burkholderia cenocepacia]